MKRKFVAAATSLAMIAGFAAALLPAPAAAADTPVFVENFESPAISGTYQAITGDGVLSQWHVTGADPSDFVDLVGAPYPALDKQALDLNGSGAGTITTNIPTVAGQTYTVEYEVNTNGGHNWTVTFGGSSATGVYSGPGWEHHILTITATGTTTPLTFQSLDGGNGGIELDNITVINGVPQPPTPPTPPAPPAPTAVPYTETWENPAVTGQYAGIGYMEFRSGTTADGWTVTAADPNLSGVDFVTAPYAVHTGAQALDLSGCQAGSISRTFATTPGTQYVLDYFVNSNSGGDDFTVSFGGYSATLQWSHNGWDHLTASTVATASTTTLTFTSLENSCAGVILDDISVAGATQPAALSVADVTVPATGATGAIVDYSASVSSSNGTVVCTPASGTLFAIGTTTVSCTASGPGLTSTTKTFTVTVTSCVATASYSIGAPLPKSSVKLGSTLPVKVRSTCAWYGGANIAIKVVDTTDGSKVPTQTSTSNADTTGKLRWDGSGQQYIYNLATSDKSSTDIVGHSYRIDLTVGTSTVSTTFTVTK